jgi:hypothetical protein
MKYPLLKMGRIKKTMGQTKGIAIRIDQDLLKKIENHKQSRNELVNNAIESYLYQEKEKEPQTQKKNTKQTSSSWAQVNKDSKKLKKITTQASPQEKNQTETITDDLYNEIYSTIYNIEVIPLKKQLELKNDLIHTLQNQNKSIQQDKQFLFDHIEKLEARIPMKKSLFSKKKK